MSKLIDLVKKLPGNPTADDKKAILEAAEAFKTEVNDSNKLAREEAMSEIKAKLETEKQTNKNLTSTISTMKKEAKENSPVDVKALTEEFELKLKAKEDEVEGLNNTITEYTTKDKDDKLTKYVEKLFGDVDMEFKEDHIRRFKSNLIEGSEDGVYLAKDDLGNKILADTARDSYLEKHKRYIKDPAGNVGGSDNTGNNQSNTGGLPQNRTEYNKLPRDARLKLKTDNPDHVRKILT